MKSCVSLLSAVCGQPETVMERWLDLYYQVRHAQEKADAAARAAERLKEAEPFIIPGTLEAVDTRATARVAPTEKDQAADAEPEPLPEPLPETKAEKAYPSQALRASSPQGASQESAEDGEAKAEPEVLRENRVKRPGGKGTPRPSQIGNTRCHDAAVFKRQVRDRLEAVRQKGVSAPELVKAATKAGAFTANNIYEILEGKVLKIEIYRALEEALRHFEN